MLRSFPAPGWWCGGYVNATGDFRFMRELEMGHTGISVNIMLSSFYREDLRDREIPSHRRGGTGRHRCGGRRCDVYCIRYRRVAARSAGCLRRAAAVEPGCGPAHTDQLATVLNTLQDPSVSFANKGYLVEGGIPFPASIADHELQKAAAKGSLPLTFNITNIAPAGPGAASATITATGPHLAPTLREPHVRRSGRLEAVARLGDDADPVGAFVGPLTRLNEPTPDRSLERRRDCGGVRTLGVFQAMSTTLRRRQRHRRRLRR